MQTMLEKTYEVARNLHQKNQANIASGQNLSQSTVDLLQAYSRSTVIGLFQMIGVNEKEAARIVDEEIIGAGSLH